MTEEITEKEEVEGEIVDNQIELPAFMIVRDLAEMINSSPIDIIKVLMANGVMANINQQIDFDTAAIVASELGFEASLEVIDQLESEDVGEIALWRRLISAEDKKDLGPRPPVVTILGHVDHGKTTLLDAIRSAKVAEGEVGGITQHISAYQITHNDRLITFLDTPGHAAFTAMRSRGAQGADIVILVIAADDGVMPQTKEALNHAKAAGVPIIVAMNKIDRPNANPERLKQQLAEVGLVPDDWDGDTIVVPVSAIEKTGLEDLMEAILLVSDNTEILANPEGQVFGTIIEAERDRARGVVASMLVQNGTLKRGDVLIAGTSYGKIKAMFDYHGNPIEEAGPSSPISVMGFDNVPEAGEFFRVVESEKAARVIVVEREQKKKDEAAASFKVITLENMFERFQSGLARELRLIVKADVQGSLEPIVSSLKAIKANDDAGVINVQVLHSGTGNISESDVMLANTSQAIVMGFNVSADTAASLYADREKIDIRFYDIIYRMTEDVEKALKGMLLPEEKEVTVGKAEVKAVFKVRKAGNIAGSRVTQGEIQRNAFIRVMRAGEVLHENSVSSLKHEKDNVNEVRKGFECGIGVKGFDAFQVGDILECYIQETVPVS
ncbi:MAG: translation initiation factor IF-2 [Chloroflexi bacterium]|jgi:translation initiation factor IF-2|nr:translation initiation factor IF-2 [Chloroflexota bacterium]MBT3671134.1 translation initiation factor IF-2 [Chloroflexota bacterium]MBT4004405.1 translation initiation factor IF-2 [Chloroflexota bacterium]MBT4304407.1 translation initiation factor IF-2 [Chloroflexota bacterium]MBT4534426.1 translation initiation factor IF-2 [Chloroflexota bacterium]